HHAVRREAEAGQWARRRARRDDGGREAELLGLVALDAERAGVLEDAAAADDLHAFRLRDGGEPAREPADDALGLPLAEGVERDPRLAEARDALHCTLGPPAP